MQDANHRCEFRRTAVNHLVALEPDYRQPTPLLFVPINKRQSGANAWVVAYLTDRFPDSLRKPLGGLRAPTHQVLKALQPVELGASMDDEARHYEGVLSV